jgi:hypothetical protein
MILSDALSSSTMVMLFRSVMIFRDPLGLAHREGELNFVLTAYKNAIQLLPQAAWIGQS